MNAGDLLRGLFGRGRGGVSEAGSGVTYGLGYADMRDQPLIQPLEQSLYLALAEPPLVVRHVRHEEGEEPAGDDAIIAGVATELLARGDDDDTVPMILASAVIDALQVRYGLIEKPLWPPRQRAQSGFRPANARGDGWRYIPTNEVYADRSSLTGSGAWSLRRPRVYTLESERWGSDEVVKLRFGHDSRETWRGRGALDSLSQVLFAEFHTLQLAAAAVANAPLGYMGSLGKMNEPAFRRITRDIRGGLTGRRRGELTMHSEKFEAVHEFKFDPRSVDFEAQQKARQAYADQALGIPSQISGGLLGSVSSTYENYRTAERLFYRRRLRLLWRLASKALTRQWLYADLGASDDLEIAHDLSGVEALQEDRTEAAARIGKAYLEEAALWNEYRVAVGLQPRPDGDVLRVANGNTIFVRPEELLG